MSAPVAAAMTRGARAADPAVPQPAPKLYDEWCRKHIPDLSHRVIVVTGANAGLGFWATRAFVNAGATVVMACRSPERGEAARKAILGDVRRQERRGTMAGGEPEARMVVMECDLASFASVRAFAAAFLGDARFDRLDVLCCNAGVAALAKRKTADGFDVQFQTNHLGHFLLTALLFERLRATAAVVEGDSIKDPSTGMGFDADVRVVHHSAWKAHQAAGINFQNTDDGRSTFCGGLFNAGTPCAPLCCGTMAPWTRYGQSKLANLLFAYELQRKCAGSNVKSVAAHPGDASTNLQKNAAEAGGWAGCLGGNCNSGPCACFGWKFSNARYAQSALDGALPLIMACVGPSVDGGAFVGPERKDTDGPPGLRRSSKASHDAAAAAKLWAFSEEAVGQTFAVDVTPLDSDGE